jgi:hypothetical protein
MMSMNRTTLEGCHFGGRRSPDVENKHDSPPGQECPCLLEHFAKTVETRLRAIRSRGSPSWPVFPLSSTAACRDGYDLMIVGFENQCCDLGRSQWHVAVLRSPATLERNHDAMTSLLNPGEAAPYSGILPLICNGMMPPPDSEMMAPPRVRLGQPINRFQRA